MSTITTPNMNLNLPVPGTEAGPTWAQDLNTAITTIDGHNHTPGSGVQIPVAGINVNTDLSLNSYNLTTARSVILNNQSSALSTGSDKCNVYVANGNLYFNNSAGTPIQVTTGNSVNTATAGNISGIGGTQAALTYSDITKTFTFTQSSGVTANISGGSVSIYEDLTGTNPVVIKSPSSLANTYTLTLPTALPAQTNVMTLGSTGTIGSSTWNNVAENRTRTTGTTVGLGGVAISNSCGSFVVSNAFTAVTNLSVSITTSGRPICVLLQPDGSSNSADFTGSVQITLQIKRGSTIVAQSFLGNGSSAVINYPGTFMFIDTPAAGTYTYSISAGSGNSASRIEWIVLVAYEL